MNTNFFASYLVIYVTMFFVAFTIITCDNVVLLDSAEQATVSFNVSEDWVVPKTPENSITESENIDLSTPSVSSFQKMKRWINWEFYGKTKFPLKEEFYRSWNSSFSLRSKYNESFDNLKKEPLNYIKSRFIRNGDVRVQRSRILTELRNSRYVHGYGWVDDKFIADLRAKGFTIQLSKIVRI